MKKLLLALLSLGSVATANAQSFTTEADTVFATVGTTDVNIYNRITNTTGAPFTITWKRVDDNIPASWKNSPAFFGVCDNYNCYSSTLIFGSTSHTSSNYNPGVAGDFHVQLTPAGASGTYFITLNLDGGGTSKNITYVFNKFPTAISNVPAKNTDVSLYPNPARNTLNVSFDENAGVKTIAVYNLIGKAVSSYRVNGGSNAQLDIDNIPAGIYLLRMLDAQGRVLATRKFTHQ